ncbi:MULTISPECIES: hypothetical protein [Pasteurellaceae]|uniref:Lipoprotein n=1 Tax=Pasteurella atlantica TaxID=2827233 RepID=A0AAW8CEN3_9PAST|nr:hypothetical protein [Pasteurella atlantica]MBR0574174.1 hypothetical protein [Pasteurella atlantica]MDP8039283.1 hypothetical protein [Pasteurella atlantica]MDP8041375.1 hypothetical protein [Pasteurella atlantica]MDP8043511.1 hypothetical protein [Pasteurella atlantica]MDP8045571.1 hypothetical protein [Pasteurella atlantica]
MKKLLAVGLLSLILTGCSIGAYKTDLLATKPILDISSQKTVEQYLSCIKPTWITIPRYSEEKLPNGLRLIAMQNAEKVRHLLDIVEEGKGSRIKFYDASAGGTFMLGNVMIPTEQCAKY